MTTTTTEKRDPFAAVRDRVPTRYAPGWNPVPYDYPNRNAWYPVIYYPLNHPDGDGPIWLVEPFPAERADGTDGMDPIDGEGVVGVAVLRGTAAPIRMCETDALGDHVLRGRTPRGECAYDVAVTTHRDLMAAWCEAYAIAAALNSGLVKRLGLKPEDIDVLLAAERGDLVGDSRFAGTVNELRWTEIGAEFRAPHRVPVRQATRLRSRPILIEAGTTRTVEPLNPDTANHMNWIVTTYQLTRPAQTMLSEIRRQYTGATRCRVCGCTADRACPGRCAWVDVDLCTTCHADDPTILTRDTQTERFLGR